MAVMGLGATPRRRGDVARQRIAILGWGSLLWDLDTLAPHVAATWAMRAGPGLPMEFSRISPKRKLGLVVCLDPENGTVCATHAIQSSRGELAEAIGDLALRERAPEDRIGWAIPDGTGHSRLPQVVDIVARWCASKGWTSAIWTDLEPNFAALTDQVFGVKAGLDYLKALTGENLNEAHRYIRNAPLATRTPLRRALAHDPWWRGLRSIAGPPPLRNKTAPATA